MSRQDEGIGCSNCQREICFGRRVFIIQLIFCTRILKKSCIQRYITQGQQLYGTMSVFIRFFMQVRKFTSLSGLHCNRLATMTTVVSELINLKFLLPHETMLGVPKSILNRFLCNYYTCTSGFHILILETNCVHFLSYLKSLSIQCSIQFPRKQVEKNI